MIIAGRSGMGKTSLATNIAFNVASAYDATQQVDGSLRPVAGGIVAFFSLEMSSEQLATRVLSEQAEVPSSSIRRGDIGETDFGRLLDCRQKMRRLPLFIDQTGALSIAQVAAPARRLKRQRGLHLIVVGLYPKRMQGKSRRECAESRQEARKSRREGQEQHQRGPSRRGKRGKRAQLSDLEVRDERRDVVMFVYH